MISQPFIDNDPASPPKIGAYMSAKGFLKIGEGAYYHVGTGVLVHDLHPRKAVLTPQGNLRAIDPAIIRATLQFAGEYAQIHGFDLPGLN